MWSLESIWLLKADRMRLNAFQAYCLRRIFRIAPSFISRVSNVKVLERGHQAPFTSILENRQRRLFIKIQAFPCTNFIKQLVCDSDNVPKVWHDQRSRGRPCQRWVSSVYKLVAAQNCVPKY